MRHLSNPVDAIKYAGEQARLFARTYSLLRKLSSINGAGVDADLLNRTMYNSEFLPPLGKEYWWFLFFCGDKRQLMLLIYRKNGQSMVFNGEDIALRKINKNEHLAVTACWIYDGKEMHDFGASNSVVSTSQQEKTLVSQIGEERITLKGEFPTYELEIGRIVHLKMNEGSLLEKKCAHGVLIPPFGIGWTDVFSNTEGEVLGKAFTGTAHLQKVVGIIPYGPFHWARVIFRNGSMFSFFGLKAGKDSKRCFRVSVNFYNHDEGTHIRFRKPRLRIERENDKKCAWRIDAYDRDHKLRMLLTSYTEKTFTMVGGGSQTYVEYAVTPEEFQLETEGHVITLKDLGEGVGTLENAYGSPIS